MTYLVDSGRHHTALTRRRADAAAAFDSAGHVRRPGSAVHELAYRLQVRARPKACHQSFSWTPALALGSSPLINKTLPRPRGLDYSAPIRITVLRPFSNAPQNSIRTRASSDASPRIPRRGQLGASAVAFSTHRSLVRLQKAVESAYRDSSRTCRVSRSTIGARDQRCHERPRQLLVHPGCHCRSYQELTTRNAAIMRSTQRKHHRNSRTRMARILAEESAAETQFRAIKGTVTSETLSHLSELIV